MVPTDSNGKAAASQQGRNVSSGVSSSPYSRNPGAVAHAFVAGREAADATTADCPFDAAQRPDEHGAWHRGYHLGRLLRTEA